MKFKSFMVEALPTGRNKKGIATVVDETVSEFLNSENGGILDRFDVQTEFSTGVYGKAFVTVFYEPNSKK